MVFEALLFTAFPSIVMIRGAQRGRLYTRQFDRRVAGDVFPAAWQPSWVALPTAVDRSAAPVVGRSIGTPAATPGSADRFR